MSEYQPLFLKYRPQSLADLIGQESVAKTLSNAIEHNRIFHAYLFTGPRGTGKTSSARILAKSLNCINGPTVTPCQTCASCEEIKKGNSSSVFEIDAASNNSVDDARLLIERAPLVAQGGRYKIYIIDECHMLTKEAFNALLKTIEEPPPNVVFVLATTEEQKVLPTIVSRCQRLMFRLVNQNELAGYLGKIAAKENIAIEADALAFIARRSAGGLRDALGLLDQASLLGVPGQPVQMSDLLLLSGSLNEDVVCDIGDAILAQDGEGSLKAIHSLLEEGREPYLIASELAKHFLNLAKASYVTDAKNESERRWISGSPQYIDRLVKAAQNLDRAELSLMVEALDRLEQTCKRSSTPALNLEIGILSLCHRLDIVDVRALQERVFSLEKELNPNAEPPKAKRVEATKPSTQPERERRASQPPHITAQAPAAPAAEQKAASVATAAITPAAVPPAPAAAPTASVPIVTAPTASAPTATMPAATAVPPPEPTPPIADTSTNLAPQASLPHTAVGIAPAPAPPAPSAQLVEETAIVLLDAEGEASEQKPVEPELVEALSLNVTMDDDPGLAALPGPPPEPSPESSPESVRATETTTAADADPNCDLDAIWTDLLEELQKRNIPTFSLVSTHAFPVAITSTELTIGVFVETFQKMIESKLEHIKAAIQAVQGKPMFVKVRIGGSSADGGGERKPALASRPKQAKPAEPSANKSSEDQPAKQREANDNPAEAAVNTNLRRATLRESTAHVVQDAYKLFEGPGSRLITST